VRSTTRIVRTPPSISIVQVSLPTRSVAPPEWSGPDSLRSAGPNGARITAVAASRVMLRIGDAAHDFSIAAWQSPHACEPA
jgi:hypothetical protein